MKKCLPVLLSCVLLTACIHTRPLTAARRADGVRVGVSRQTVFLKAYDQHEAIAVAMDHAEITVLDSSWVKRRPRAFGSAYVVTVTGK